MLQKNNGHCTNRTCRHVLLQYVSPSPSPLHPEYPVRGLDLVFVLDSSGSVGELNFTVEKQFAINITSVFNIGPEATRVGGVAFSGATYFTLVLDSLLSSQAVRDGLTDIPYNDFPGPSTNTSGALRTVRETLFAKEGGARPPRLAVPRVVIVITDGRSNVDRDLTLPSAAALHQDGVTVFAVGIGQRMIRVEELQGIASRPQFASLIGGFNVVELQGVQRVLSDEACRGGWDTAQHKPTNTYCTLYTCTSPV